MHVLASTAGRRAGPTGSCRCPNPGGQQFVGQFPEASFAIGQTATTPALSSMQGIVTEAGQIRIAFTSSGNPTVIGIGQMREISGVPLMEMQMITGTSLLTTHWAYMAPYNPAVFTPPSATQYVARRG